MDELLTTRQLQELLQVDRITVYRMLDRGLIPGFKVGGQWRFSRSEVEAWLARQRGASPHGEASLVSKADPESGSLLPLHCFQAIQDITAEAAQVFVLTVSPDGEPLTQISNPCSTCGRLLSDVAERPSCSHFVGSLVGHTSGPAIRRCPEGLWLVGAPVVVGGERVAGVMLGGFHVASDGSPLSGLQPADSRAVEGAALEGSLEQTPVLSPMQVERMVRLAGRVAETLSQISEERLRLIERLKRIAEITSMNP